MTPTPGQPLSEADVSLLPCPFCGSKKVIPLDYKMWCENCHAYGPPVMRGDKAAAWNRRPHAPVSRPGDGVEIDERTGHPTSYSRTPPAEPVSRPAGEGERIVEVMREHIRIGEIGACSVEIVGHEEAADAILSLLSPAAPDAGGGWMPADDVPMWSDGIVTDGERVARAQKAEADYGGFYWAVEDADGALEWEPTHFAFPPALQPGGER